MRGPFGLALRRCLRVAAPPTLAAAVFGAGLHALLAPRLGEAEAPAAASPWLVLPLLTAAACCTLGAAAFWPMFAQRRAGTEWLQRLQRGPLQGRGAVLAAALAAQLVLVLPVTVLLALVLGAPPNARRHVELIAEPALLDGEHPSVLLRAPAAMRAERLWLRPLASLPQGPRNDVAVEVRLDGEAAAAASLVFEETRQLAQVEFAARPVRTVELRRVHGDLPLFFAPGSAQLLGPAELPTQANAVGTALLSLLPSFVALALATALAAVTALPTLATAIAAALFVQWVGGIGPSHRATLDLLRGRWLFDASVFAASVPSLALGCLAMFAAALPWVRSRR